MYFHYFVIISPWKRAGPLFEQTWIPFTQGCIVSRLIEIGPLVLKKNLLMSSMYYRYFVIISTLKKTGPFIWTRLNPPFLQPRVHCAKFGWNWSSFSWEDFKISSIYFRFFENLNCLRQRQRKRRQRTNFDQKSSLEPSDVEKATYFGWSYGRDR